MHTEQKDECWICAHSIMTVFIWSHRIGQVASTDESITIGYYKTQIEKVKPTWKTVPSYAGGDPYILGNFTNWQPVKMQEVVPFCIENDEYQPDFKVECVG